MVRSNATEASDDKKEATKRKTTLKKKTSATGIWPCKINGCNKQFAREADLKRHQRTTKVHSMPSFACPQCDATFTRTDALRRHQKSRHNGVVLEPSDQDRREGAVEARSSGSPSRSRSGSPSAKGKERARLPSATMESNQPSSSTGGSSYYRSHTATSSAYVPPRLPMIPYAHVGLPTSATRLHSATNWGYPHPWPEGMPPPSSAGGVSYHPVPMYYPSPHYRQNGDGEHPSSTHGNQDGTSSASLSPVSNPNTLSSDSSLGMIDPSLDDSTPLTAKEIAAAMAAVLKEAVVAEAEAASNLEKQKEGDSKKESGSASQRQISEDPMDTNEEGSKESSKEMPSGSHTMENKLGLHNYGTPLERPEPMEHMLTEDGEPMLNPAELLTQESLASPPPS